MKKYVLLCVAVFVLNTAFSQLLTWSPQFPTETSTITITVDATKGNQGLLGVTSGVYMHLGVLTNLSNGSSPWKYVPAACVWGTTTAPAATAAGTNKWTFTITNPRTFFNVPAGETITKVALLFRDANANPSLVKKQANTDGSDMYIPLYTAGASAIQITAPPVVPTFIGTNETTTTTAGSIVPVTAASSISGNLVLNFNGTDIATTTGTTISGNVTAVAGSNRVIASLNGTAYDTLDFFISIPTVVKEKPVGSKDGINYYNCTDSVTLVLYAPNKTSSMLIGDFPGSNWTSQAQYQMYRTPDGNYYWITVHGLTSGTEYAYQYLVDNSIYIADNYSQKILDPNDRYINPNSYPDLKPYPTNPNVSSARNGIVSVLQICEPQYNWAVNSFTKPDKKNLIIYELLVRDFSKPNPPGPGYDSIGNYQTIIDSIGYLKRLGINAVEFMPLQEFGGNISWGYNPNFYFAPDKVYGTKNKLKELIDTLHKNGIAVLLDVVYNHIDAYNTPIGKLYWDAANSRPAANNPWLNTTTPHSAYKFFEDFNHTSAATQNLVKTSLEHWITEYKVDGFRFDFTKGFTQTVTSGDNSAKDQSRIDNLNRYYDYIVPKYPDTYMILEHFCASDEENILINKGFMPWREMFAQYKESLLGTGGNKNFGPVMWNYGGTAAPTPSLVGFMDSHDKERLVYECLQNGGASGPYVVKSLNTALARMEAAAAVFFTVPGPKMVWQFDEFGYDIPRANNTDMKAPRWDYLLNANRAHLLEVYQKLIQLRLSNTAVFSSTPTAYDFSNFLKYLQIGDPVIANTQITIVANLGLTALQQPITFQKTGNWYNYISNGVGTGINGATNATFNLTNATQTISLLPGEYHVYVSVPPCVSANPTVVSPITYCQNSTVSALTATGSGLLWYTTPSNGTGVATLTPSTLNSGNTTYYVTQTAGGCSESSRVPLIVNITAAPVQPTATVTTAPTCVAPTGTITVTAPTGANIRYSKDGLDYTNTSGVFTGLTAGTNYNITAKDISSTCISVVKSVTVPAVPGAPATPQVSVTQATCSVGTATVTVTSDKTGLTFSSNGVDYTNTNGIFTIAAGAAYSITAKNASGCVSSPATGTLNAQPVTPAAPAVNVTQPTCTTATATVTITSDKTGLTFSSNGIDYTNTNGIFTFNAGASYSITAKNTNGGCISTPTTGTINAQPNVPVQPTASVTTAPTCIAPTGTITVTAPTGSNIRYSKDGIDYSNANGIFTNLAPGTSYSITAKDINSTCVSIVNSVTVPAIPGAPAAPQVSITQATCTVSTGTITITSDKTGLIFSSNGVDYTNTNGVFTNINAGTAYSITAKNSSGCVSSPATGTLNAQPVTPAAPTVSVAQPTCTTATATVTVTSDKTGLTFSSNGVDYTNTNGIFTVNAGTSYSITAKNTNGGCISTATTGTINAQPNVPLQPTASVTTAPTCIAPTGTITVTAPNGVNIRYSKDGIDYSNTSGIFTGLTPGTSYSITAKDANSTCVSVVRSVTIPAIPGAPTAPVITLTQPTCTVITGTLTITSDKTGLTFSSNGVDYTNINGVFTNIGAGAAYSITAKNAAGCISTATTGNVAAIPGPPNPPTVVSPVNYCQNAIATPLTATGTNLKWYTSLTGSGSTSSVTPSTSVSGSTTYYVSQTTDCGESQRAQLIVNVTETPAVPTGLNSGSVTNVAATVSWAAVTGATSYRVEYKLSTASNWTTVATAVTGLSVNITGLTATTLYDWRVRANCDANNGGAYASAQFTTSSFSINNLKNGLGIMVYQNPITPASKIAYIVPVNGSCSIVLYNAFGQKIKVILNQSLPAGQDEISMSDLVRSLPSGVYFLKIRQGNLSNFTKFIKP